MYWQGFTPLSVFAYLAWEDQQTVFWHETPSLILGHVALGLLGVLSVIVTAGICKPSGPFATLYDAMESCRERKRERRTTKAIDAFSPIRFVARIIRIGEGPPSVARFACLYPS